MLDIKYMDIKEFQEKGFLQEINRLFLHPLGLALSIEIDENGNYCLGGIWDYREDPEGIIFGNESILKQFERLEKVKLFDQFAQKKHLERNNKLGFIIQPLTEPKIK